MYRDFLPSLPSVPGSLAVHDASAFVRSTDVLKMLAGPPFAGRAEIVRCDHFSPTGRPSTVVCVPARDEATLLPSCLDNLGAALNNAPGSGAVLVVNNTSDASADIVRTWAATIAVPVLCCEVDIAVPADTAAIARRLALDVAALLGPDDAVLLSTDADTLVPPDWVLRMTARVREGAALVAAGITVDPAEAAALPPGVRHSGEIEQRLAESYETIWSLLAGDSPCPLLVAAGGANFAVAAHAYRAVGGLPVDHRNEDRALTEAMLAAGLPVVVDRTITVTTSLRTEARARHGMADAIAARCREADPPVDDLLVPFAMFLKRLVAHLAGGASHRLPERRASRPLRVSEATVELSAAAAFLCHLGAIPPSERLAAAEAMTDA